MIKVIKSVGGGLDQRGGGGGKLDQKSGERGNWPKLKWYFCVFLHFLFLVQGEK